MNESPSQRRVWLALIILGISLWGVYHAVGAYRYNGHLDRPAMVLLCVTVFLGWWVWLLKRREAKLAARERDQHD